MMENRVSVGRLPPIAGPTGRILTASLLWILACAVCAASGPAENPAAVTFDDCDERIREEPAAPGSYDCYLDLVRRGSDWHEADRRLSALLTRDPSDLNALFTLANILGEQGEARAEELYRRAAEGFELEENIDREVLSRRNLASLLFNRGRLDEAQDELDRAAGIAEASQDRMLVALVRNQQAGQLVLGNRDLGRAYRMLKEVEATIFPRGSPQTRSGCLYYLAIATFEMGRFDESATYFERMVSLDRQRGNAWSEANAYLGLLRVHEQRLAEQQSWSRAEVERLARQGLETAERAGNRYAEATFRGRLAKLEEGVDARRQAERALDLSREMGWSDGVSDNLLRLAEIEASSAPAAAFALVEEAVEHTSRRGKRWKRAQALVVGAELRWKTGPRSEAIADSLAALDALEQVRDLQSDEEARARVFSMSIAHYTSLIGRLLSGEAGSPSREDLELAFAVSERRRARGLLETLDAAAATSALVRRGETSDERQKVLRDIAGLQRRLLDETLDAGDRLTALAELERLERSEEGLRAALAQADPRFAELRSPDFASLAETEAALGEETALLVYQLGTERRTDDGYGGGSWVMAVTSKGTRAHPLADARRLAPAIELFLGLLESGEEPWERAAERLYGELLEPVLEGLDAGVRRLLVIPDGELHRLPVTVLGPWAGGEPVLARFETSIVPSATTWLRLRQRPPRSSGAPVLAFADPERSGEGVGGGAGMRGDRLWRAARLGSLPAARAEGRAAVRRLGGESLLLAGPAASEAALKAGAARSYSILHFATHAVVDERRPERSAIVLAPGSPDEDGLLQLREVVALDLQGQVVVLSACRSAGGEMILGEGLFGLARAFFQAGARAVVASLWPLRDEDGRRLMEDLYAGLGRGESLAVSLTAAQRRRRLDGAPPNAWAGVVLLGDGEVGFPRQASRHRWWIGGAIAALLSLAAVQIILRQRRENARPPKR